MLKNDNEYFREVSEHSSSVWRAFTLNISFIILLFILGIFIGIIFNNERLINSELEIRAKSHFNNILITRKWNEKYGGTYVEKKADVETNPFLEDFDIETIDGKIFTMKNHALMTKEISDLSEKEGMNKFNITSLDPLNPSNEPDEFERKALESFEKGANEVFIKERLGEKVFLRYMAPLITEESCLQCHGEQGYKTGDIRGGISVKFEITNVENKLAENKRLLTILFVVTVSVLIAILYFFIVKLKRQLVEALRKIQNMAITDDLTKLNNRRYFISRFKEECNRSKRHHHSLSCIMMDIDSFKQINDNYGHEAGDLVLQSVSDILKHYSRETDVIARYGGEEFIKLMPETELEGSVINAERIRLSIETNKIVIDGDIDIKVTASFGVATVSSDEWDAYPDFNKLIKEADSALYRSKNNGRNRISIANSRENILECKTIN